MIIQNVTQAIQRYKHFRKFVITDRIGFCNALSNKIVYYTTVIITDKRTGFKSVQTGCKVAVLSCHVMNSLCCCFLQFLHIFVLSVCLHNRKEKTNRLNQQDVSEGIQVLGVSLTIKVQSITVPYMYITVRIVVVMSFTWK